MSEPLNESPSSLRRFDRIAISPIDAELIRWAEREAIALGCTVGDLCAMLLSDQLKHWKDVAEMRPGFDPPVERTLLQSDVERYRRARGLA